MSESEIPDVHPDNGKPQLSLHLNVWLDNHHQLIPPEDGESEEQIHVFADAGPPSSGYLPGGGGGSMSFGYSGASHGLQGVIHLVNLDINATLFIFIPFIINQKLMVVKGNLRGDGVRVGFNLGIVRGVARFYASGSIPGLRWLTVQLSVWELFRRPLPLPLPFVRTIRLIPIPQAFRPLALEE
ncbi:hypothetical protein BC834DRAFT_971481 [Gloeopeniophorella convolvens]|nr:hypothetical protein BC834DRAFT_971481 [Gloeopeniophorella convolvens]